MSWHALMPSNLKQVLVTLKPWVSLRCFFLNPLHILVCCHLEDLMYMDGAWQRSSPARYYISDKTIHFSMHYKFIESLHIKSIQCCHPSKYPNWSLALAQTSYSCLTPSPFRQTCQYLNLGLHLLWLRPDVQVDSVETGWLIIHEHFQDDCVHSLPRT